MCPQCTDCRTDSFSKKLDEIKIYNEQNREKRIIYPKNKRETDVNFRLIINTRNKIYKSLKVMTKQSSTRDVLGIDIDSYNKWIKFIFTPEMNWSNIEIDHIKPICMLTHLKVKS